MTAVLEPPAATGPTLEELKDIANNGYLTVVEGEATLVETALRIGKALLEAKERVVGNTPGHAGWVRWLDSNFVGTYDRAVRFMLVARHEHVIGDAPSLNEAYKRIAAAGVDRTRVSYPEHEAKQDGLAMREKGCSYATIAEACGVSVSSAYHWVNPQAAKLRLERQKAWRQRRAAERKAAARSERREAIQKALRAAPDPAGRSHEATTKMDQWLGQWREQATSGEQRIAINKAHALRDQLMDAIDEALRLGYVS